MARPEEVGGAVMTRACDSTVKMPAVRRCDDSAETVRLDEAAIARLRAERDAELIDELREFEGRVLACGKTNDASLLRAVRERLVDLIGGAA